MRHMVWSILLLTLLCGVCSAATLSVCPADSTIASGETVNLTVRVQDVSNLGGFDIDMTWNPSVVTLDSGTGNVTFGPLFSGHVNNSAVYIQKGRIRAAGVNATLEGVSGSADLFTVRLKAIDDTGTSTPVSLRVNNYGFLNSTSGENITVSSVTGATIKTEATSTVEARIAAASNQMLVGQTNLITASVVNRRGSTTSPLTINISIIDEDKNVKPLNTTSDVTIPGWGSRQWSVGWTPDKAGTYTAVINVASEKPMAGKASDNKTINAKDYTLNFTGNSSGPWDGRASAGSCFYIYTYVKASHSGYVWFNVTTPDHVEVYGPKNQTRYMSASDWNYVGVSMRSDVPGQIAPGDIKFEVTANNKTASQNGPSVLIWIPSIRVSSTNTTSVGPGSGELTFNTLHTNNTYDNTTRIVIQAGAQGRTLSGLEYLVGYPYGCVEQTTSRMMASLNVKNYYINRDRPADWDRIRKNVNDSVEAGVKKLLVGGEVGQNPIDGGWNLWGPYSRSESSSSSYASYTLARINDKDEDLNRLLKDKITNGTTFTKEKVNFESVIRWFHDNPDNPESGTWSWSAPVCHAWVPESNTAFVMLIHDMINQTVELDEEHRGYMEDNMRNATRYLVEKETNQKWPTGEDQSMARALALWGLEAFAMPSDDVSSDDINATRAALAEWLISNQKDDGSWPADSYYGWYYGGRKTEATAYGVLALNATGLPADNGTILDGVNWLTRQYSSGGGWGYTWASQVAIDALIRCQPAAVIVTDVTIEIDGNPVGIFSVNATHPRVEYTLTEDQMNTLMAGGTHVRYIDGSGGYGKVRIHTLTGTSDTGPIIVSVDHSQSAPIREIDGKIQGSRVIQSFGYEEEDGPLHVSTDIGILSDAPQVQENTNTYDVGITASRMVAGEGADVTITVRSLNENVTGPMIEIPIAGFAFGNATGITENGEPGAFEYLNGTTGNEHPSLFIQSAGWEKGKPMTYSFKITPEDHGTLDLDLRIRPLYDDTNVYQVTETFTVMGRGNVSVNVVDGDGAPANVKSITLIGEPAVQNKSSHDFTGILEGTYTLIVNGTNDYPSIRTAARVTPGATALCNVTLPSSLIFPTLVYSEGGAGSIAGVEQVEPERLNALRNENTTYTVTVLGDGGEIGIALEFPMRYLMTPPVVKVNENPTKDYEIINGTFRYVGAATYSTTNATLIVYNTTAGSNTIKIEFEGGRLGDSNNDGDVTMEDALYIASYSARLIGNDDLKTYDYPDVNHDELINIEDALFIASYRARLLDEYYLSRS